MNLARSLSLREWLGDFVGNVDEQLRDRAERAIRQVTLPVGKFVGRLRRVICQRRKFTSFRPTEYVTQSRRLEHAGYRPKGLHHAVKYRDSRCDDLCCHASVVSRKPTQPCFSLPVLILPFFGFLPAFASASAARKR